MRMKSFSVTTNEKRCIRLLTESDVNFNLYIMESQANNRQYSVNTQLIVVLQVSILVGYFEKE